MCLFWTAESTRRMRKNIRRRKSKSIVAYKVYRKYDRWLLSPFLACRDGGTVSCSGDIVSSRESNDLYSSEKPRYYGESFTGNGSVSLGIHVFLDKEEAIAFRERENKYHRGYLGYLVIVKVTCHSDDFVASNEHEAVFTKVCISEEEFKKG